MIPTLQQVVSTITAIFLAFQATFTGLPVSSQLAQVTQTATLTLSPSATSVSVSNTFTANIILNTGGQGAYGVDINRLRFNPSILQVVDADAGTAGVQITAGSLMSMVIINSVDNSAGSIQFSQVPWDQANSRPTTYSGSGTLATITFRAISAGTSNVTLDFTLGSGIDTNVAGLGGDLLASVGSASYAGIALDVTPPTISAVALSGITASGATVSWTTNESADTQVDYGLTASYGNSTTLNSSLTTSHSATLSGLSAGTAYYYRVKSRDVAGNIALSSGNVLTTISLPDTTAPSVPSGLTATPTSESQIQISWSASTDLAGVSQTASGVSGYQVFRGSSLLNTTAPTAYLDTGLTPNTAYTYQVTAVDNAGNISAKSVSIGATTPLLSLSVQRKIILIPEGAPANRRNVSGTVEFLNPSSGLKIFQASFIADSSGQYIIDVPAGLLSAVNLRPVISGYLSQTLPNIDLRNTSVLDANFPTLPAGDFNSDQLINSLDFSYMNGKWGTNDALSDINRDGIVNSLDFAYVSNNWLLAGK